METRKTATETTGTPDAHYNLISVIYHALQGAETYDQYAADAERSGDRELSRFLRDVQAENRRRAERAKELLYERLGAQGDRYARGASYAGVGPDRGRAGEPLRDRDEFGERERRRAVEAGTVTPAGGQVRAPERPAPVAPAADVHHPTGQPATGQPATGQPATGQPAVPSRAPLERGFAAGQDARNADRSFEEVEPELRRDYEAERPGGDPWEELREQVRTGFTQARQSRGR